MFRSFPFLVVAVLAVGVVGAEANQLTPRVGVAESSRVSLAGGAALAQAEDVAAKVKAALKADADLSAPSDGVTVTGAAGVVTLEGTVPTVQLRARIAELAMKVEGVTKLVNKLKLAKK
jgi:osmotically-inducible protein OsmY